VYRVNVSDTQLNGGHCKVLRYTKESTSRFLAYVTNSCIISC